jgi:glycosyltransferase involved in cell wall biosynthesis
MDAPPPVRLQLLAPPLDGPPTGGTLYNRALLAALRTAGAQIQARPLQHVQYGDGPAILPFAKPPTNAAPSERGALQLVDSLYLEHLPALKAAAPGLPTWLLLHYLPAQVQHGRAVGEHELSAAERTALASADAVVATSPFMADQLTALGLDARRVLCVEPGFTAVARSATGGAELRALVLGSVTQAKGQLELLTALARELRDLHESPELAGALQLDLVGSLAAEPEQAAACRALIASEPALRTRVTVHGSLGHDVALAYLARASVLLSASRMESYGMALSEARAAGVPIIARAGGHAAAHVSADAGGALCSDAQAVARELLLLVRDRPLLAQRDALARAARRSRSWSQAAAELLAFVSAAKSG